MAGPVAWASDLGLSYSLVQWSCSSQRTDVLHAISAVSVAIALAGGCLAWSLRRATTKHDELEDAENRARFMATLGVASSAMFALAIVAFAIPRWMLDACQ